MAAIDKIVTQLTRLANSQVGTGRIVSTPLQWHLAATGAPQAVFADNASSNPGLQINSSEIFCSRWNNAGSTLSLGCTIDLPSDLDTAYNISVNFEVFKIGATLADATTMTFSAFVVKPGQLVNADADCGGVTGAVLPTATSLTIQTISRDIASADLVASLGTGGPGSLSLIFGPTAAVLTVDDFACTKIVLTYTRRSV